MAAGSNIFLKRIPVVSPRLMHPNLQPIGEAHEKDQLESQLYHVNFFHSYFN
jgi:hypothetical protein